MQCKFNMRNIFYDAPQYTILYTLYLYVSINLSHHLHAAAGELQHNLINDDLPPEPKRWKEQDKSCPEFVSSLRQVYRTAQPPTWDPLPQCQHVKLAMIKEKGKRCGSDKTIAESRVEGDVDKLLTIKVPVDSDRIFDAGAFDDERQVILVEGVGGMGKTTQ